MFKKMKDKSGYISIETIIVAGLMIGLGAYAITQFYMIGQVTTDVALDNVEKALDVVVQA